MAQNSLNSVDSIMAALLTLEEVDDAFVIEKYEDTYSYTVEDKTNEFLSTLKSHSIYACVALKIPENEQIIFDADGAKDPNNQLSVSEKIARTIWRKKTPGCALNGAVPVYVKDDTTDNDGNRLYCDKTAPKYLINFDFVERVNICVKVTLSEPKPIVGDPLILIQDEIYNSFTGQNGSRKPRIGSQVLASQFYCVVQSLGDWARVVSIKVGFLSDAEKKSGIVKPENDFIEVDINQIPVLDKQYIQLDYAKGASNG